MGSFHKRLRMDRQITDFAFRDPGEATFSYQAMRCLNTLFALAGYRPCGNVTSQQDSRVIVAGRIAGDGTSGGKHCR